MRQAPLNHLLITLIPSIAVLALAATVGVLGGITMDQMTRDFAALADMHPLSGALSNLGILLWGATASVCLFVAFAIRDRVSRYTFLFLLASALLSGWLLFDDLFSFHEGLAPVYLGVSETSVIGALAVAVFGYLVVFRRAILKTHYLFLGLAFVFLGGSVVVDGFEDWLPPLGHWMYLLEDGLKWLGICCWCGYFVTTAHQLLGEAYQRPGRAAALVR